MSSNWASRCGRPASTSRDSTSAEMSSQVYARKPNSVSIDSRLTTRRSSSFVVHRHRSSVSAGQVVRLHARVGQLRGHGLPFRFSLVTCRLSGSRGGQRDSVGILAPQIARHLNRRRASSELQAPGIGRRNCGSAVRPSFYPSPFVPLQTAAPVPLAAEGPLLLPSTAFARCGCVFRTPVQLPPRADLLSERASPRHALE
jgi:hypothetical protein